MRPSVVIKKNNFIMNNFIFARISVMHGSNQSIVARYRSPAMESLGFKLMVNKTLLVPPDTEHDLRTMNVQPWCWCWGRWQRLTGLSTVFFLLGIVVEYPLFISSHNPMQKIFSLLSLNQLFASEKSPFNVSRFQFIRHPISLFLNHSHLSQSYRNGLLSYLQWFCKLLLRLTLIFFE